MIHRASARYYWVIQTTMLLEKALIIVNPAAGRGKARKLLGAISDSFSAIGIGDLRQTQKAGDEESLARQALDAGTSTIIVVGGDGTCARVANVILERRSDCALAVVPCGTGNDFAKTLGVLRYNPEEVAALVAGGSVTRIDVGRVDDHYFINSCGFGFDASVLQASQRVRYLKGEALYIYSALAQLFSYQGIEIAVDGIVRLDSAKMLMAIASNGRYLGGAFRIAPSATVTDGKLDFCLFADNDLVGRVRLFLGALRGTHPALSGVITVKSESLSLTFGNNPAMEVDGELRQTASRIVTIECIPNALAVVAAPGAPA
jgi:diacylglycerol kinase (ATP)